MKIWIVETTEPLPLDSGVRPMRCGILSDMLVSLGHDVTWWTSTFYHSKKVQRFDQSKTVALKDGLEIRLLYGPEYARNVSLARVRHNRAMSEVFGQEMCKAVCPKIIFCCLPTLEMAEKSIECGQRTGIPVVVDIRDQWPDVYLTVFPRSLRRLAKLVLWSEFKRVERICHHAASIVAVSNTYLKWGLGYAGRRRHNLDRVFTLGYPSHARHTQAEIEARAARLRSTYGISPTKLVLAFVGTFGAFYDLETVVEAARLLERKRNGSIQIVLAGDGDKYKKLRNMSRGLRNVIFTGWIDEVSIFALMHISSVGLSPYIKNAFQSLPNKPFEYMAAGLPILSSLQGELEMLIRSEKLGIQYQAGDVSSLVESVLWFLENIGERKAMGLRARKLLEDRFSVEKVYSSLAKHLEHVGSERSSLPEVAQFGRIRHA